MTPLTRLLLILVCTSCVAPAARHRPPPGEDWRAAPTAVLVKEVTGLLEAGDLPAARQALASGRARGLSTEFVHILGARVALAGGRFGEAEEHLDQASALVPELPSVDVLRGRLEELRGRWSAAREAYGHAAAKAPGDPHPIVAQARTLHAEGLPGRAATLLEEALRREPLAFELLYEAGRAQLAAGDPEQALGHLRQAEALRPTDLPTTRALALTLYLEGRFEEVLALLQDEDRAALPTHLRIALGRSALLAGRFSLATDVLGEVAQGLPDEAGVWFDLARAAFLSGQQGVASRAAQRGLALQPAAPTMLLLTGHIHYRAGRLAQARHSYELAMRQGVPLQAVSPLLAGLIRRTRQTARAQETTTPGATAADEPAADTPSDPAQP